MLEDFRSTIFFVNQVLPPSFPAENIALRRAASASSSDTALAVEMATANLCQAKVQADALEANIAAANADLAAAKAAHVSDSKSLIAKVRERLGGPSLIKPTAERLT